MNPKKARFFPKVAFIAMVAGNITNFLNGKKILKLNTQNSINLTKVFWRDFLYDANLKLCLISRIRSKKAVKKAFFQRILPILLFYYFFCLK